MNECKHFAKVGDGIVQTATANAWECPWCKGERLQWLIGQILGQLPQKRDWLNPDIEREMRAVGKT